MLKKII